VAVGSPYKVTCAGDVHSGRDCVATSLTRNPSGGEAGSQTVAGALAALFSGTGAAEPEITPVDALPEHPATAVRAAVNSNERAIVRRIWSGRRAARTRTPTGKVATTRLRISRLRARATSILARSAAV